MTQKLLHPEVDTQALGTEVSQLLKWDGLAILLTMKDALTDANFHKEAKVVEGLISNNNPF